MLFRRHPTLRALRPWLIVALLLALVMTACGAEEAPPPTPTKTPLPTFTPTPPETPTPIVAPTNTPEPATPTPAEPPTSTLEPPTPTPAEPPTPTPEPPTPTPAVPVAVIDNPTLNVRQGPGTNYSVIGQANNGDRFDIRGKNSAGSWWQIDFNGRDGWVSGDFVRVEGDAGSVQVAANIPAAPTQAPVPPTNTPVPQPTQPPAPTYAFNKYGSPEVRPNSNPLISVFAMVYTNNLLGGVGDVKVAVSGPGGSNETACAPDVLRGDPGLPSEFIYNCKVEIPSTAEGVYSAWVVDGGGNQVSEAWELSVSGEIRTFLPRWQQR